jgi:hypothetical protein
VFGCGLGGPVSVFGRGRKPIEGAGPDPVEVGAEHGQAVRVELVDAPCTDGDVANEMSIFEHLQVERDRGTSDRQSRCQLADREGSLGQQLDDRSSGAVTESGERQIGSGQKVSRH